MTLKLLPVTLALVASSFASAPAQPPVASATPADADCLACHGDPAVTGESGRSVTVTAERLASSIHGQAGITCVTCHADLAAVESYPHPPKLEPVRCANCHDGPAALYGAGVHAEARGSSPASVAAACKDCHGTHEIRAVKDPESLAYHLNLPATCGRCHGSDETIRKGRISIGNVVARFQDSIHGQALSRGGLLSAPNCSDCHGAHDIRRKGDPGSRVFRANVPAACGNCHAGIERRYRDGIHGQEFSRGNPDAPVCVTCHGVHEIPRVEASSWRLQVLKECGSCHEQSIRTYRDTFHGQVTELGFLRMAVCADCHGAHEIHPGRDARSTVSAGNLVATCRKCHPAATARFVRYDPHADRHDRARSPALYFASVLMKTLLAALFLFFGAHATLWVSRAGPLPAGKRGTGRQEE